MGATNRHAARELVPECEAPPWYSDCNFSRGRGVTRTERILGADSERAVFSCDYNGWADVPEEEREGVEAFEAFPPASLTPASLPLIVRPARQPAGLGAQRKAA